jgi:hypothetical protein
MLALGTDVVPVSVAVPLGITRLEDVARVIRISHEGCPIWDPSLPIVL